MELMKLMVNKNYESLVLPMPSVAANAVMEFIAQLVGSLLIGPAFLVVLETKVVGEVV